MIKSTSHLLTLLTIDWNSFSASVVSFTFIGYVELIIKTGVNRCFIKTIRSCEQITSGRTLLKKVRCLMSNEIESGLFSVLLLRDFSFFHFHSVNRLNNNFFFLKISSRLITRILALSFDWWLICIAEAFNHIQQVSKSHPSYQRLDWTRPGYIRPNLLVQGELGRNSDGWEGNVKIIQKEY